MVEEPNKMRTEKCPLDFITWMEMIRNMTRTVESFLCYLKMICWDTLLLIDLLVFTKIRNSSE